ncbi:hypothetical protein D3C75_396240 [compost metagenome]
MSRKAMKESLTYDLKAQLETQIIDKALHDKALSVVNTLTDDDWKDIDNMSTVEAADMVLSIARIRQGA